MEIQILPDKFQLGLAAATRGAEYIRAALSARGEANIIVATGASQFEMLAELVKAPGIDWSKVTCFHLDEYVGIGETHPASFCRYLKERFVDKLPTQPKAFHYIKGEGDAKAECARVGALIDRCTVDVAFIGIGENGHLAFNDPPADFDTTEPYIVVTLDEACRRQQFGEGWFAKLEDVPKVAISMSIACILMSKAIVCTVPDARKAEAVENALEGAITNLVPASALQNHPQTTLFLDPAAASRLSRKA